MYFFYPVIAGPIFEEMIYRGLVMTALEKGKKWGTGCAWFGCFIWNLAH